MLTENIFRLPEKYSVSAEIEEESEGGFICSLGIFSTNATEVIPSSEAEISIGPNGDRKKADSISNKRSVGSVIRTWFNHP